MRNIILYTLTALIIGFFCLMCLSLPSPLFDLPFSHLVYDDENDLISTEIAIDEQWRFPSTDSLPNNYKIALLTYEDEDFYKHAGIDVPAIIRAIYQNLSKGKIVSGASTISMQVMRLAGGNSKRTFIQKMWEMIQACQLEIQYSKDEILQLYATHAPFGGNIVGLEAACKRYLNKKPSQLSWSEASLMAVLPNSPSLIFPGKNQNLLIAKRNFLLDKLSAKGYIRSSDLNLYKDEPIPDTWVEMPRNAEHLLQNLKNGNSTYIFKTSIKSTIQKHVSKTLKNNLIKLQGLDVHNAAVLVLDNSTGQVISYLGNIPGIAQEHSPYVDLIRAERSPGSLLKPFLYAKAIDKGTIGPFSLLSDTPVNIQGYSPKNFDEEYDGIVKADQALIRSLNIPFIKLLHDYNLDHFYSQLPQFGITTMRKGSAHYGLGLILGNGETTLWEITHAYAGLSKILHQYLDQNSMYSSEVFNPSSFTTKNRNNKDSKLSKKPTVISATAAFYTLENLQKLKRPEALQSWESFENRQKISWKTGTSMGFKDAWAIGTTKKYSVGVWVGNADGEGRNGLVGLKVAAPILFQTFSYLHTDNTLDYPYDDSKNILLCKESGYRATANCPDIETGLPINSIGPELCNFHKKIHCSQDLRYRVNHNCYTGKIIDTNWLIIPPMEAYYYNRHGIGYNPPPPFLPECDIQSDDQLGIIYPPNYARLALPDITKSEKEKLVLRAYHTTQDKPLYWYLNSEYLGKTSDYHEISISPQKGDYTVMIQDEKGNVSKSYFYIIE